MVNLNPDKPSTGALCESQINLGHVLFDEPANTKSIGLAHKVAKDKLQAGDTCIVYCIHAA